MKQTEDITDHVKTAVFRKHKDTNEIIALFPLVPSGETAGECYTFYCKDPYRALDIFHGSRTSPSTQYWHSEPYNDAIERTVPAIEKEYTALHRLISALGHQLQVVTHEDLVPPNKLEHYKTEHTTISTSFNLS